MDFDRTLWAKFKEVFKQNYGHYPSVISGLFLVGLNQFTSEPKITTKEEKQEVIHVGLCALLSQENIYKFSHFDADGWPHFVVSTDAEQIQIEKQENYIKKLIINYFYDTLQ